MKPNWKLRLIPFAIATLAIPGAALGQNPTATPFEVKTSDDLHLPECRAISVSCLTDKLPGQLPKDPNAGVTVSFLIKNNANETIGVGYATDPSPVHLYTIDPNGKRVALFAPFPPFGPYRSSMADHFGLQPGESKVLEVPIPASVFLSVHGHPVVAGVKCLGLQLGPFYAFSSPFHFPIFK
jgi:hypothetical protein